jgi:hypothetical protein
MTITTPAVVMICADSLDERTKVQIQAAVEAALAATNAFAETPAVGGGQVPPAGGWDVPTATRFLELLEWGGRPVQAAVIRAAAAAGGRISRAEVYNIGAFGPERKLKGFTRPINRVVNEMQLAGDLAVDAVSPLEPVYDPGRTSFHQAKGFSLPPAVAAVFAAAG